MRRQRRLHLLNEDEIDKMLVSGRLAARLLRHLGDMAKPGVTTNDLDREAEKFATEHGAINAPLNYEGFPKSICTSVNDVVCHGIPNDTPLKDGDIVKIDVTLIVDKFHGDTCATFFVGDVSDAAKKLTQITADSLKAALDVVKIGNRMGDIGHVIQEVAEPKGYSVVREFQGHGIGTVFHTAPDVPHFGRKGTGPRMRRGMSFTIEPMINVGAWPTRILADNWTAVTRDGSLSAQFEHTMVVGPDGPILTTVLDDVDPWAYAPGGLIAYSNPGKPRS